MCSRKLKLSITLVALASACSQNSVQSLEADALKQQQFEAKVEDEVRGLLRDPQSAMFSDITSYPDDDVECGQVNSKNGFGGYVGKRYFAYSHGTAATEDGNEKKWEALGRDCIASAGRKAEANLDKARSTINDSDMSPQEKAKALAEINKPLDPI